MAPAGDAAVSVFDVREIADVAVAVLTQAGHDGKTYDITGPEALTHTEMARRLATALGKPVKFVDVSGAAFCEALLGFHIPKWQADGVIEDYAHDTRGEAAGVSTDVRNITGHVPRSFSDFATDFKAAFLAA